MAARITMVPPRFVVLGGILVRKSVSSGYQLFDSIHGVVYQKRRKVLFHYEKRINQARFNFDNRLEIGSLSDG